MKVVIFTSNAIRHKYVANAIAAEADDAIVISECKPNDAADVESLAGALTPIQEHFYLRYRTEQEVFRGNDFFKAKVMPLAYKEANLRYVYDTVKRFAPDMMFVFGSCIIKEPLLSLLPPGRFVNLHLGMSPYYRGSGTNFWPFVNRELEYVGSTLLHIDAGIDTGDIVCHVRPKIEPGDNVHSVGCKVIQSSADAMVKLMKTVAQGRALGRVKQWKSERDKFYRKRDFDESILQKYKDNLASGMIEDYLRSGREPERCITLE